MESTTKTFLLSTELLEFDRHNPRLIEVDDLATASDEEIMCELVKSSDISELVESIVANTYLDIEPLIVIKDGVKKEGNYRVLEGNRRLSAIRFLQSPELAATCKLTIPDDIKQNVYDSLEQLTVYEVQSEEDSKAFIAFKHINGAHRWNAYAKARYITDWYIKEYDSGITIGEIASRVGDNNSYVRSIISGMLVLNQAEESDLFQISDRTKPGAFGFSHLYTALNRLEYKKFLGLDKDWNQRPSPNPVKESATENLKEILQYLYGSKRDDIESVVKSQNPDLKRLGYVLSNRVALSVLRHSNDLTLAEEEVRSGDEVFEDALIIAYTKTNDAMKKVTKFSPDTSPTLIETAEKIVTTATDIVTVMKSKSES